MIQTCFFNQKVTYTNLGNIKVKRFKKNKHLKTKLKVYIVWLILFTNIE